MVTTLSKLVEMIEHGSVPDWWREQIIAHKEEIVQALRRGGSFTLTGQNGEQVTIHAEKQTAAA